MFDAEGLPDRLVGRSPFLRCRARTGLKGTHLGERGKEWFINIKIMVII